MIRNMDLKTITLGRDLYAALAMRFVVVPAACVVFLNLVPMPKEMKEVFFMLSSMPAMAQMGIMARQYDSDYEFACTVITVTTLITRFVNRHFQFFSKFFEKIRTADALCPSQPPEGRSGKDP